MIQANIQQIHDVASALATAVGQLAEIHAPVERQHYELLGTTKSQAVQAECSRAFNLFAAHVKQTADILNELSAQLHQAANLLEEADRAGRGR